jgi:ParB family chromosome partitioning protein
MTERAQTELCSIPIDRITPSPHQPRRSIDRERLFELSESIRRSGVLQPIRVRPAGAGYEIIAGERRWRAARDAGLSEIPAIVVTASDEQVMIEALVENVQRVDLNPVDRAMALRKLRTVLGLRSWTEVGRQLGIGRVHVHRLLHLTQLPDRIQGDIRAGTLNEKHGRVLARLSAHPDMQEQVRCRILAEGLSSAAAQRLAAALLPAAGGRREAHAAPRGSARLQVLLDQFVDVLLTASPTEIDSVRGELMETRRWLGQVLGREGLGR